MSYLNWFYFYSILNFIYFFQSDLDKNYIAPCGACRQFIAEFGLEWNIILIKNKDEFKECTVREVLPFAFDHTMLDLNNDNLKSLEVN